MTNANPLHRLAELIYPSNIYCISCGALIDSTRLYSLCDACMREIPWNTGKTCAKCGKVLSEHTRGDLCHDCKYAERSFDSGLSCATYTGPVRALIRGMKYCKNHSQRLRRCPKRIRSYQRKHIHLRHRRRYAYYF